MNDILVASYINSNAINCADCYMDNDIKDLKYCATRPLHWPEKAIREVIKYYLEQNKS